jgi:NADPH:quinone reductase-like Zn-dependent oxidoreductase
MQLNNGFGINQLEIAERPRPVPGPGEVLVKVNAVSLNYRDLGMIDGFYNPDLKLPFIPVSDGVGEIIDTGGQTSRFKAGDRVCGIFLPYWITGEPTAEKLRGGPSDGMLAEYVLLNEEGLVHAPGHLNDEEAATLPCAAVTAWQSVIVDGKVKAGDTIVVQGTGGVSLFALQFAKLQGARVIVTSSSDEKLEQVKKLGADSGINYRKTPDWDKAVLDITDGRGADLILDLGGAITLNRSVSAVRIGGQVIMIGILSGVKAESFNIIPALQKKVRLQGMNVGSREMFESMNRAIEQNKLHPVIDRVFSFGQSIDALKYLEQGYHFGKICIKF